MPTPKGHIRGGRESPAASPVPAAPLRRRLGQRRHRGSLPMRRLRAGLTLPGSLYKVAVRPAGAVAVETGMARLSARMSGAYCGSMSMDVTARAVSASTFSGAP